MPYTQEQIDAMFADLPGDVKDAMSSVDTVHIIIDIQKKYNLHIDQVGELSTDAALLMVGALKPQEFIAQIEANLHVPKETAKLIATEVNEKIFRPVRESLMSIHKMKDREEASAANTDTPALLGEIPEEQAIKNNAKNEMEVMQPTRSEIKEVAESKIADNISLPPKTPVAPDPYRESPI